MSIAIGVIGGLGLFLYGMQMMGAGLQKAAGKKLERIIEVLTTNRFMGVFVGMLVTGVIQSSSATTVMVVGFVNAGIMNLTQAVGVIMGANIGTTITGQIVSMSIDDIAPISIGVGMIIWMTTKKDSRKTLAEILIGLGILFLGMEFLKDALKPLRELEAFNTMILSLSHHPVLGVLVGFALTFIVQSSSASIGMLIALASQGVLPLAAALPILYGDNIGTCTTALLSSIGASKNARRAAIIHLAFNAVGTLLFVILLSGPISKLVTFWDPTDVGRQIANAHTVFNLANVVIQFPFAFFLVKVAMWVVPDKNEDKTEVKVTRFIDDRILETPTIAIKSAINEALNMGYIAKESLSFAMDGFFEGQLDKVKKTFVLEKDINTLETVITEFLVKLSNREILDTDRRYIDGLFNNINDIERIGDHADNIAELVLSVHEKNIVFTEKSKNALLIMYNKTRMTYEIALKVLDKPNQTMIDEVMALEKELDTLEREARHDHFARLNNNECSTENGVYYLEIVNNLERISDLSCNLVRIVSETAEVA
ncbi:Na/Pi cotransporter family protein [Fusibacter sp. 3D3]|uniref:Na/Pi cotransporter family protein n=1 Tax=Fusibacter sp. 3D3 TaxID=1048380 RepID=UPI000852FA0A|nr:Na/Pi cotransporter family protein [Fusibacter sp. 3D3]GAU79953.1 sodium-dependent phosphate transporter [Fusibacter sp. 3D3]